MVEVKEPAPYQLEIYTPEGKLLATVNFEKDTNAASGPSILENAATVWSEIRHGEAPPQATPLFRFASALRNAFRSRLQQNSAFGAGKQRQIEESLMKALGEYVDFFKAPSKPIVRFSKAPESRDRGPVGPKRRIGP